VVLSTGRVESLCVQPTPRQAVPVPTGCPLLSAGTVLGAAKANKGVFVTTSYFTKPALEFAEKHPFKMVLVDGDQLTTLMIRHNVGVRVAESLNLKKIDEDFFSEE
jgi:restriction system protein